MKKKINFLIILLVLLKIILINTTKIEGQNEYKAYCDYLFTIFNNNGYYANQNGETIFIWVPLEIPYTKQVLQNEWQIYNCDQYYQLQNQLNSSNNSEPLSKILQQLVKIYSDKVMFRLSFLESLKQE